ncbi:malectin domain-containing carbohydrate-binding protein [Niabella insulamsoli]|uniref:malectin domain-containing carbohydrate-binding protein n=1 Tax=Niabella insulamsoli TaxID=3144874 RepID=UPI003D0DC821
MQNCKLYNIIFRTSYCCALLRLRIARLFLKPAALHTWSLSCVALFFCGATISYGQRAAFNVEASDARKVVSLNSNWLTMAGNDEKPVPAAFQKNINVDGWKKVNVPHNWDDYYGYRRLLHGNKHGDAWYRKKFSLRQGETGKRYFLFFEGVGSYASVFLNGKRVGDHAGGRTTFTIDVSAQIKTDGAENLLAVRAWHPPFIKDLPWVCGGCSDERGFSEGSQPMGIFRPVSLIITNELRIEPFGVHVWADVQPNTSLLHSDITIKNYASKPFKKVAIVQKVINAQHKVVATSRRLMDIKAFDSLVISNRDLAISAPVLWSVENPYLYKIKTSITLGDKVIDEMITDFGFRTIRWQTPSNQFYLNGKPVFINGVAEYEHLLGQSHAFSQEQVVSRVEWLEAAGFNAFRDGHQPHNLLYGKLFNERGMLWWTQLSAHIWYDTPSFKRNFKQLLKEWVIERRNDPAVVLWGLQNESKIPKAFAEECTRLIRSLDPTAATERLVTTCNGGEGTDWDVPQNWTGTYGGDPNTYGEDLKKQVLVGEYGAWRTLDLHTEGGYRENGPVSEDRFTQLMEKKLRLAASVKDSVAGHFFWLLTSHDNPGRVQGGEGLREIDRVGPVNYKGMLTPWEEPTDVFYMFRSHFVAPEKEPMVYIASHTWPNRWMKPGLKDSIIVYSNCDEVELFNDINATSLGKKKKGAFGTPFLWNDVNIRYNILYAVGYMNGKPVARDTIQLFHLPQAPHFDRLYTNAVNLTAPAKQYKYLYRLNCGGNNYTDQNGNLWNADRTKPASFEKNWDLALSKDALTPAVTTYSWTDRFPEMPAAFASQRRVSTPLKNTVESELFQTFRYGKHELQYQFVLRNGDYVVELYFSEPWIGVGGGMNGKGMRIFDVAFNGQVVCDDLDIWKEVGTNKVLKKAINYSVKNNQLVISFPETKSGQAIINAIAIASKIAPAAPMKNTTPAVAQMTASNDKINIRSWMDIGDKVFSDQAIQFNELPPALFGADWIQRPQANSGNLNFSVPKGADVFIAIDEREGKPGQISAFENTDSYIVTDEGGGKRYLVYKKRVAPDTVLNFKESQDWLMAMVFPSNMQPAYDLKPTTSYKSDVAQVNENVSKKIYSGNERTIVTGDGTAMITWPVETGVADVYAITVKYYSPFKNTFEGKLQLIDANKKSLVNENVAFKWTKEGKWNYITINTGTMINAGNYQLQLTTSEAKGLIVSNVDIQ